MNVDAEVMEFSPRPLAPEQSFALFERLRKSIAERGWGLWAVEIERELAGFTGLAEPSFHSHFTPCTEIGWRFQRRFWGHGYALEAARIALRFAFTSLRLREVVSFTARLNERSERLMRRLGMTHSPTDDFEHPMLPVGHTFRCRGASKRAIIGRWADVLGAGRVISSEPPPVCREHSEAFISYPDRVLERLI